MDGTIVRGEEGSARYSLFVHSVEDGRLEAGEEGKQEEQLG